MDFLMFFLKLAEWLVYQLLANSCYRAAMKVKNHGFFLLRNHPSHKSPHHDQLPLFPTFTKCSLNKDQETLVCDIQNTLLLNSTSFFPYFMLVAFEGGSILRAFLLLLSYPLLLVLDHEVGLKLMIFITFCGLKVKDMKNVGRAVMPKFYLENLNLQVYELLASARSYGIKVLVFTRVPRVMVEGFCKEYLNVDDVMGTELHSFGGYFSGFVSSAGVLHKHKAVKEWFGNEKQPDVGIGSYGLHDQLLISQCKEGYVVSKEDGKRSARTIMPRDKYPKPLVFHDGRLAFFPTPLATLCMFLWFPLGVLLAIIRLCVGIFLPYPMSRILGGLTGVNITIEGCDYSWENKNKQTGVLFVCTHRTLLDPVFLTMTIGKPLTAVTYSLSKMSEMISPIKTVRLTRDRKQDGETMHELLSEGDLVVCPEGTTCREPYLLRFSSLFAELTDEIVPVAMNTHVTMFYGTTASGLKCLDPIYFLMNPRPSYHVKVLGKLTKELTCAGGKSSHDVANYIQKKLGDALGFECTNLTRKDKYLMLAGNQGIVEEHGKSKKIIS
ncbi:putative glycerol-3-phosphate 1-O-acyltransferase [Helianthus annuus]|uniref:Glycerol-3-phosphate 1-O-acyltransferase n=1 Tax=Helianthus annuus TaxID=4232 RepID=A0A251SL18_HELAN|nr:glycerol-3-phosphate acyltransferase 1 [Helianthus annuus]KAF5770461.1 putative glycerol-3-phosphate 1-O-acyltransferase [Helianthus annuus]KAJ0470157.1 putative glycerol-3-phosphate 1-O-acyltransferase [Helianthus annuus]KAJ0486954.1 putative glycerol-3-phosphate 1-O-acyltransferase [Helianthus annuus]